jgi:hypothetical protein
VLDWICMSHVFYIIIIIINYYWQAACTLDLEFTTLPPIPLLREKEVPFELELIGPLSASC